MCIIIQLQLVFFFFTLHLYMLLCHRLGTCPVALKKTARWTLWPTCVYLGNTNQSNDNRNVESSPLHCEAFDIGARTKCQQGRISSDLTMTLERKKFKYDKCSTHSDPELEGRRCRTFRMDYADCLQCAWAVHRRGRNSGA